LDGKNEEERQRLTTKRLFLYLAHSSLSHTTSLRHRDPDLLEPHLLRSLLNVRITSIHTSCSGCHFVCLDSDGQAWLFGRNGFSCLGVSGVDFISESAPRRVRAVQDLGASKGTKIVHAACGRNHTLLVGSDGSVWSAGANNFGQVGATRFLWIVSFNECPANSAASRCVRKWCRSSL
jgi:alpha-tubulin suppressor-like RCC1 family protein